MKRMPRVLREAATVPSLDKTGIYIHIPFCVSKCGYCDFYSFGGSAAQYEEYTSALLKSIHFFEERFSREADTLYFGGGTPSLLGGERIARIIEAVDKSFPLSGDAEITLEANPADDLRETLRLAAAAGVNRLSLGVQSADAAELRILGRRHTNADVIRTVADARAVGIDNISLDLMLAIPNQSKESLAATLDFMYSLAPSHISSYLLKLEEGTPFHKNAASLSLPDEDKAAELYLSAVENLAAHGYGQYEISNFAKDGAYSHHNMKYWTLCEYLGIGAAAHSFMDGKRFYFGRDAAGFINGAPPTEDGPGGGAEEYVMLRLRLCEGLDESELASRFGILPGDRYFSLCERLAASGHLKRNGARISMTPKGFLLNSYITGGILDSLGL